MGVFWLKSREKVTVYEFKMELSLEFVYQDLTTMPTDSVLKNSAQ